MGKKGSLSSAKASHHPSGRAKDDGYQERHRERYAELLGRIVVARSLPANVREENALLYARLLNAARSERVKACSGWIADETREIDATDPLIAWADAQFGTIEEVADKLIEALERDKGHAGRYTNGVVESLMGELVSSNVVAFKPRIL